MWSSRTWGVGEGGGYSDVTPLYMDPHSFYYNLILNSLIFVVFKFKDWRKRKYRMNLLQCKDQNQEMSLIFIYFVFIGHRLEHRWETPIT